MKRDWIGGSDVGAILGIDPRRRPIDVYMDLIGLRPRSSVGNSATEWGKATEGAIANLYERKTGRKPVKVASPLLIPGHPIGGSPDRLIRNEPRGLEIKSFAMSRIGDFPDEGNPEGIPLYIEAQCRWYSLLVSELLHPLDSWDLIVQFQHAGNRIWTLERDEGLEQDMRAAVLRWHRDHIIGRRPPDVDESESYRDFLKKAYPDREERIVMPNLAAESIAAELSEVSTLIEQLESQKSLLENLIRWEMKDGTKMITQSGILQYITRKAPRRVDWKGIAKEIDIPKEVIERYTNEGEASRPLIFKTREETG